MRKHIARLSRGSQFKLNPNDTTIYTFVRTIDLHTAEVINLTTGATETMRKFTLIIPA